MSVTRTEVDWDLLGEIPTGQQSLNCLRILPLSSNNEGVISYTGSGTYKVFYFYPSGSSLESDSVKTYTIPFSGLPPAFPTQGYGQNFAWFFSGKINSYDHPNIYTIEQETTGNPELSLHGFDAIEGELGAIGYIAYCMQQKSVGFDNKYLQWGRPAGADLSPRTLVNVGFTGDVRLSRNGLYCCVFGDLNSAKTIRVYTPQSGAFASFGSTTSVKVGGDIVVPGNSLSDVLINNTGTRLLASTQKLVHYYELVASQWVLQSTISIPLEANQYLQGISINAESSILIASSSTALYTYTLSDGAWFLVAQMGSSISNNFAGSRIDLSQNSVFLAAVNGQSGVDIYRSTITEVTYDTPVITPGQTFTIAENNIFSGTLAMLSDGLNRQVTSWSATGLPAGLIINATTGIISGTATLKGQFSASITATNPDGSSTESVQFIVQSAIPIFAGAVRATAIYAGATAARALYYGARLLWNVPGWQPPQHEILESLATINPADGSRGHSRFLDVGLNLDASNLARIGFKFGGGVRIKNATITTPAGTYTLGVATNWNLVRYFTSHDLTITSDGIGRSGFNNIGGGWDHDVCGFWLDIPASSLTGADTITVDYEYSGGDTSKHGVCFWNATTTAGGTVESYIGTWGNTPYARLPTNVDLPHIVVTNQASVISNTLCRRRVIIKNNP
jgi:hypothetical protein